MATDSEFDEVSRDHVVGYGGLIVRDGKGLPLPEAMALEAALPNLLQNAQRVDDVVVLLEYPGLRLVALKGLGRLAHRHPVLPRRDDLERAISPMLTDSDADVRTAAAVATLAIRRP